MNNKFVTAINTDGDYDTNLTEKCALPITLHTKASDYSSFT